MPSDLRRRRKKTAPRLPPKDRLKEGTLVLCQGRWTWGVQYTGKGVVVSDKGKQGVSVLFTDDATGQTRLTGIFRPHIYAIVEEKDNEDDVETAEQQPLQQAD